MLAGITGGVIGGPTGAAVGALAGYSYTFYKAILDDENISDDWYMRLLEFWSLELHSLRSTSPEMHKVVEDIMLIGNSFDGMRATNLI